MFQRSRRAASAVLTWADSSEDGARGATRPTARIARQFLVRLAAVLLIAAAGCKKQEGKKAERAGTPALGETILQVHWIGRKGVEAETNSAAFMQIWDLPESTNVVSRFLDQLSLAPWRLLPGNTDYAATNPASATLRPLLDDLVDSEYYLHVSRLSNQPPEIALALKLDAPRVALWEKDLPVVWASLAASSNDAKNIWPRGKLEIRKSREWTFVGIGRENNPLLGALESAVRTAPKPPPGAMRLWLEASIGLPKIISAPSWFLPGMPHVDVAMTGNPQGVSTKAILNFAKPLPFEIEPWNIPTNLIHAPIHGFTALQGIRPFIASNAPLNRLFAGSPPNQLFTWSQTPYSALVYAAAPEPNTNVLSLLDGFLVQNGNPWLATNANGRFEPDSSGNGIFCTAGNPLMGPFLRSARSGNSEFLLGGLGRSNLTNQPPPDWLIRELSTQTNVMFYEREVTAGRVQDWLYLGQALRIIFWKSQLPFEGPEIKWFAEPAKKLGNLLTVVAKTGPRQLTINRSSGIGLNAIEIHCLADWLESPTFPRGTHTTVAEGMARPGSHHRTNALPSSATNTNR